MPRRNNRRETYVPLDVTPPAQRPRPKTVHERIERQRLARERRAIDWTICVVPGCGRSLIYWDRAVHHDARHRDTGVEIPICVDHAAAVWRQMTRAHNDDPRFIEAIADINERVAARTKVEKAQEKADHLANTTQGEIYFVRIGGLVKVGWTRDLWSRLKSYGASAELLACYPASRDDETTLHRQLRPALAKGREWYEDGPVIAMFIQEAFDRFGAKTIRFEDMWTTPKQVVAGKRHGGRR